MEQGIKFFGKVDYNKHGRISSEYPAWYFDTHIDTLKESINRKKRAIERGDIPPSELPYARVELEKEERRMDEINESKPKFTDKQVDTIAKVHETLGRDIRDSMFTREDMMRGTASPHEENRRENRPCIEVKGQVLEALEQCGIKHDNGKISRNQAAKAYKILGKSIGANTMVERLRKDGYIGRKPRNW